jgi:hypothetical protein
VPLESWDDTFPADLKRYSGDGLDGAAGVLVAKVTAAYGRKGMSAKRVLKAESVRRGLRAMGRSMLSGRSRRGAWNDLREASKATTRKGALTKSGRKLLQEAEGERGASGAYVDPPGGMPRSRTGALARSAGWAVDAEGNRVVGIRKGPAAKYAGVHEFGATIRPRTAAWLMFRTLTGGFVKTKLVKIPMRPVWRPMFRKSQGEMFDGFVRAAQRAFDQDAGTP